MRLWYTSQKISEMQFNCQILLYKVKNDNVLTRITGFKLQYLYCLGNHVRGTVSYIEVSCTQRYKNCSYLLVVAVDVAVTVFVLHAIVNYLYAPLN